MSALGQIKVPRPERMSDRERERQLPRAKVGSVLFAGLDRMAPNPCCKPCRCIYPERRMLPSVNFARVFNGFHEGPRTGTALELELQEFW